MIHARHEDLSGPGDALVSTVHHASHDQLMTPVDTDAGGASVDAIIVPTIRPVHFLEGSLRLARELDCPVLALCSGEVLPAAAVGLAERIGARLTAVDCRGAAAPVRLRAGAVAKGVTPGGRYVDLSLKRNVGLLTAWMTRNWRRVLFLDDDLRDIDVGGVRAAAAQLDRYTGIGLRVEGQPDNSVVCHAFRDTGGIQSTFVGGGALLVPTDRAPSHFPDVYNEDWFFLLEGEKLGRVGRMGFSRQDFYDPYDDPGRARAQEFGDCLAEGVFALLDDGGSVSDAALGYWDRYLDTRRSLIEGIVAKLPRITEQAKRDRMTAALAAAAETLAGIEPRHCMAFLDAWRADQGRWSEALTGLPAGLTVGEALAGFAFADVIQTAGYRD
ncbi:hypothetical protein DMB66_01520 [Actinoplanes sp. ATCC 53533]|nr:hypothetical protein DMB66_01520 [Actinoplanes sp. ATCC 53533]